MTPSAPAPFVDVLRIGGASLNQTPLDWAGNTQRIALAMEAARQQGVALLGLPELCIPGYGCEDAFHGEAVVQQAWHQLWEVLPQSHGLVATVGLPLAYEGRLYNVVALLVNGQLAGVFPKRVLAGYGVYYEPRWFSAWPVGKRTRLTLPTPTGQVVQVPLGDYVFEVGGVRLGFEICEEAWARDQLGAAPLPPVDVWINPSAGHFSLGKHPTVRRIVQEGSRMHHAGYLYTNLLGNEAGKLIFDGVVMVASNGTMLAEGPRFGFGDMALTSAVVDLRHNRLERQRLVYPLAEESPLEAALTNSSPDEAVSPAPKAPAPTVHSPTVVTPHPWPTPVADQTFTPTPSPLWPTPVAEGKREATPEEEFTAAVPLALWDYLRKSKAGGFAVSLSGGVDSASVALLAHLGLKAAWQALGAQGVLQALPNALQQGFAKGSFPPPPTPEALSEHLLLTAYQATAQSSNVTRQAAAAVAELVGSTHHELEIQPLVEAYEALAQTALGRSLTWQDDDLARQNIQARVRSPGIWLLANLRGLLLLATSNRSELGVGYATMDGDTSGGLAPIAGANKTFLRGWLRWMEAGGCPLVGALPALAAVNEQAPTAELRPAAGEQLQTDEADLMPYPLLDAIEQAAIRDKLSPLQVWQRLKRQPVAGLAALTPKDLALQVQRFFKLWAATQWKRERMAPGFHLDDESLDPKYWCRFPLLSGGYATELAQLMAEVEGG